MTPRLAYGPNRGSADDVAWQIAHSIQARAGYADSNPLRLGELRARRHPTGWFVSADRRADLSVAELEQFDRFVTLNTFGLLTQGLDSAQWEQIAEDSHRAVATAETSAWARSGLVASGSSGSGP